MLLAILVCASLLSVFALAAIGIVVLMEKLSDSLLGKG